MYGDYRGIEFGVCFWDHICLGLSMRITKWVVEFCCTPAVDGSFMQETDDRAVFEVVSQ